MATAEEIAKALEGSGWEPIKQALMRAYGRGRADGIQSMYGEISLAFKSESENVGELPNENP